LFIHGFLSGFSKSVLDLFPNAISRSDIGNYWFRARNALSDRSTLSIHLLFPASNEKRAHTKYLHWIRAADAHFEGHIADSKVLD